MPIMAALAHNKSELQFWQIASYQNLFSKMPTSLAMMLLGGIFNFL